MLSFLRKKKIKAESIEKSKTEWAEIAFNPNPEDRLELQDSYDILLRNYNRYPYPNEKIALLSHPLIQDNGSIQFKLSPKTFILKKRRLLCSSQSWSLEFIATDHTQIKRAYAKGWLQKLKFQETKTGNAVDFYIATNPLAIAEKIDLSQITLRGPYKPSKAILPPWVMAPYPPYDIFWRQGGEAWFFSVWLPYWQSLTAEAKQSYLACWNAPDIWRKECPHINPDLAEAGSELSDIEKFLLNF